MSQQAPVTDYSAEAKSPESRKKPKKIDQGTLQKAAPPQSYEEDDDDDDEQDEGAKLDPAPMPRKSAGRRIVPVHQSRIADRPAKVGEKDSSLKIKIELDLEVEVEIYARVKGDVTIGLM
ncbi:Nn.00g049930.m01.CDS01 [Neocucurbitaria sp. VM-36]